jgi:hypothetical protein
MGKLWGGLGLGDVVSPVARTRRMIVTDMDIEDPRQVTCSWYAGRDCLERSYRISALVLIRKPTGA